MPLKLDLILNAMQFNRAGKQAGQTVDDIGDSLDDMARDGDKAVDKLERSFRDLSRATQKPQKDVADLGKKGFGKAGESAKEFKSEAIQNLSEVTSSFSGDMSSIGDLVQGTFGGLASSLPGVLGVAGAVAATAIGVVTSSWQKVGEATDAARESAYTYGLTVAASGKYADVAGRINDITGSVEGLKEVQDLAYVSGMKQKDVIKALATGDGLPALWKAFESGASTTNVTLGRVAELEGKLQGAKQGFELAADAGSANARALYEVATAAGVATGDVDDLGNSIVTMPDGKQILIDANTKQAYDDINALDNKKLGTKTVPITADMTPLQQALARFRNSPQDVYVRVRAIGGNGRQFLQ